jgi:hypothetical protein
VPAGYLPVGGTTPEGEEDMTFNDVEILESEEFMVGQVQGVTDVGIAFVDSYTVGNMVVVDAGRIILLNGDLEPAMEAAKKQGLTVRYNKGI